MSRVAYTTQRELRTEFWAAHPQFDKRGGARPGAKWPFSQNDYPADVRMAWVEWIDGLERGGQITAALAARATL